MAELTFSELVRDLRQRREVADPPPVLLLGAGASVEAGIGAMTDLFAFVDCADFKEFSRYIEDFSAAERYRLLARFLQSQRPAEPTPGYLALAELCADAYLDLVLTTNLDPLVDDALAAARLWRKDYLVLVNGVIRPGWLATLAASPSPRVKVVKLHGDLFHRCMAWTVDEMETMVGDVHEELLAALRGRDLLIVGHSLRDARIRELVLECEGSVWFTHPEKTPAFLARKKNVRSVVGANCTFEQIFVALARELSPVGADGVDRVALAPTRDSATVSTLDDLMASVVGVARAPDEAPFMTGFVLAEPRVIVTDGLDANAGRLDPDSVSLVSYGGRRLTTRVARRAGTHVFGPVLLDAPDDLKVPGLRIDAGPVGQGMEVHIAVAAGDRVGVSSGLVEDPRPHAVEIVGLGVVDDLVSVDAVTAPGGSGAPVVDGSLAVRGFVVAGGVERPPAIAYAAEAWAAAVDRPRRRRKRAGG